MALWTRPDGDGGWTWGRDTHTVGRLTTSRHGGIEPVDAHDDLDLVTVLCMARAGIESWDPAARAATPAITATPPPPSTWSRSTAGRAKGGGPTLAQRAHPASPGR